MQQRELTPAEEHQERLLTIELGLGGVKALILHGLTESEENVALELYTKVRSLIAEIDTFLQGESK